MGARAEARCNPWLGSRRGFLSDWLTQRWVKLSAEHVEFVGDQWLDGPSGQTRTIGPRYFEELARASGWDLARATTGGLVDSFAELDGPEFDSVAVDPMVIDFYEHTARYELELWSEWSPTMRPLGRLVQAIFSRRLGQLQLPLSALESSHGLSSEILHLSGPEGVELTGWLRRRKPGGEVMYAGTYSIARPPRSAGPCVKVVFPLPNGNATVFLRPQAQPDGSLLLTSQGSEFGDPGFYFVVKADDQRGWARYVPQMTERIHVSRDQDRLRTEHTLTLGCRRFLDFHYVMLRDRE
jgi:hypothetical protein